MNFSNGRERLGCGEARYADAGAEDEDMISRWSTLPAASW